MDLFLGGVYGGQSSKAGLKPGLPALGIARLFFLAGAHGGDQRLGRFALRLAPEAGELLNLLGTGLAGLAFARDESAAGRCADPLGPVRGVRKVCPGAGIGCPQPCRCHGKGDERQEGTVAAQKAEEARQGCHGSAPRWLWRG